MKNMDDMGTKLELDDIDLNPDDPSLGDLDSPDVSNNSPDASESMEQLDPLDNFLMTSANAETIISSTVTMTHSNSNNSTPNANSIPHATYSRAHRQSPKKPPPPPPQKKSPNRNDTPPARLRSLICDANGIIIAEMVFRCMVCAKIHDSSGEAQTHYQDEHMDENDEKPNDEKQGTNNDLGIDLKSNGSVNDSARNSPLDEEDLSQPLPPMPMQLLEEEDEDDDSDLDGANGILATPAVTISVPGNLRQLQQQNIQQKHHQQQLHYQSLPPPSSTYSNSSKNKSIVHSSSSPSNTILMPISITSSSAGKDLVLSKKLCYHSSLIPNIVAAYLLRRIF